MRIATWLVLGCLAVVCVQPADAQLLQKLKQGLGKVLENQPQAGNAGPLAPRTDDAFAPGYLGLTADEPRAGDRGVRVLSVREGSPADVVGLRTGDVVTAIDGVPMRSLDDMDGMLSRVTVGQTLRIVAERGGEQRTVMPKLVARNTVFKQPAPDIQFEDGPRVDRPVDRPAGRATLGMSVGPLTEEARRQFGLTPTRGAIVTNVVPGSPADAAKIPVGAAIVAVDGRRVDTADELVDLMRLVRPDQEVEMTFYQGAQLGRKLLRATAAVGDAPRANPPLFGEPGAAPADRPILRTLEKVLEGAGQGGVIPPGIRPQPLPAAPGDVVGETEVLRRDIEQLKRQLQQLEGRLSDLELRRRP